MKHPRMELPWHDRLKRLEDAIRPIAKRLVDLEDLVLTAVQSGGGGRPNLVALGG